MKRFSLSAFFIGIGLGMIFSYTVMLGSKPEFDPAVAIEKIPNEIVIQRAKEIGLIDPGSGVDKKSIQWDSKGK